MAALRPAFRSTLALATTLLVSSFALPLSAQETESQDEDQGVDPNFVTVMRCPKGGVQPKVQPDGYGLLHMIYFTGDLAAGDLRYVVSPDGENFTDPIRVNAVEGEVDATLGVRGGSIAVGEDGRAHVAWVASTAAGQRGPNGETPLLYARLSDDGTSFEPARNLIESRFGLETAPGIVVDEGGAVLVFWHAPRDPEDPDSARRVWMTRSVDGGDDFSPARAIDPEETGVSSTSDLQAAVDRDGTLYVLYRSFFKNGRRDTRLLFSNDGAETFEVNFVDSWRRMVCPQSTSRLTKGPNYVVAAWEGNGQVYYAGIDQKKKATILPIQPGANVKETRRYGPTIATNPRHSTILVWMEGERGSAADRFVWRVFDNKTRRPFLRGRIDDAPADTRPEVFTRPDGGFTIIY